jgi:hypothetical protein
MRKGYVGGASVSIETLCFKGPEHHW